MQDRIQVFRNEYSEFSQLDDEHVSTLIKIYDINLQKKFEPSDPSLSVIGLLIMWFGWIFLNAASGHDMVEYKYDNIPQMIVLNSIVASCSAGITYFLLEIMKNIETLNTMVVYEPSDLIRAIISGLVSVSASSNISTSSAGIIGSIGALIFISS